ELGGRSGAARRRGGDRMVRRTGRGGPGPVAWTDGRHRPPRGGPVRGPGGVARRPRGRPSGCGPAVPLRPRVVAGRGSGAGVDRTGGRPDGADGTGLAEPRAARRGDGATRCGGGGGAAEAEDRTPAGRAPAGDPHGPPPDVPDAVGLGSLCFLRYRGDSGVGGYRLGEGLGGAAVGGLRPPAVRGGRAPSLTPGR